MKNTLDHWIQGVFCMIEILKHKHKNYSEVTLALISE